MVSERKGRKKGGCRGHGEGEGGVGIARVEKGEKENCYVFSGTRRQGAGGTESSRVNEKNANERDGKEEEWGGSTKHRQGSTKRWGGEENDRSLDPTTTVARQRSSTPPKVLNSSKSICAFSWILGDSHAVSELFSMSLHWSRLCVFSPQNNIIFKSTSDQHIQISATIRRFLKKWCFWVLKGMKSNTVQQPGAMLNTPQYDPKKL